MDFKKFWNGTSSPGGPLRGPSPPAGPRKSKFCLQGEGGGAAPAGLAGTWHLALASALAGFAGFFLGWVDFLILDLGWLWLRISGGFGFWLSLGCWDLAGFGLVSVGFGFDFGSILAWRTSRARRGRPASEPGWLAGWPASEPPGSRLSPSTSSPLTGDATELLYIRFTSEDQTSIPTQVLKVQLGFKGFSYDFTRKTGLPRTS